jgi:pimeloyl-ACP methyl ester carboxylesterase
VRSFLAGVVATLGAAATAAVLSERRVIRRLDRSPAPDGWVSPRFPDGAEVMVPTDDGAELVVAIAGPDDGPPVVLVHGLTSNHHDWGPVAQHLVTAGHRVVAINQRGHGGSTIGSDGFGPHRQGTDLGQVLDALDLQGVTLVGHSMGGIAALSLMILAPDSGADRVRSLVLVATLASTTGVDRRNGLKIAGRDNRVITDHPIHGRVFARAVFGASPCAAMVDEALASAARCPDAARIGASNGLMGYDVRSGLGDISVPTTVVCGTRDRLTPLSENRRIAAAIPDAELVVVPDAGHLLIWEEPQIVASAISDRVAAGAVLEID